MVKPLAEIGDHRFVLASGRVGKREQQTRLASVLGQAGDASEQHRTAGDCFQACLRVRQGDIPTPPVVDQRHGSCRQVAAPQIMRGVASPAQSSQLSINA